jgi:crotonobetainyl-CoA:carnitine CoA-transferase CaiB-like acyl-CoA transferase
VIEDYLGDLRTWDDVETAMDRMNTAWGQVRPGAELRDQPTLKHRRSIVEIDDRAGGTRPIPQSPYRFSDARSGVRGPAPHLGEHNVEVLGEWLGRSASEVERLTAAGVLTSAPPG